MSIPPNRKYLSESGYWKIKPFQLITNGDKIILQATLEPAVYELYYHRDWTPMKAMVYGLGIVAASTEPKLINERFKIVEKHAVRWHRFNNKLKSEMERIDKLSMKEIEREIKENLKTMKLPSSIYELME